MPTSLSIEKTADKLLQTLIELKEQNVELPDCLSKLMNDHLEDQEKFVEGIHKYLHTRFRNNGPQNEMEFITVKAIVESCPELLATKHHYYESLPVYSAARTSHSTELSKKCFKLLIDVGLQHNIGGKDSRGGLLVPDKNGKNALHNIMKPETFEMLRQMDPPLFHIEDIKKYYLSFFCARGKT